jgi:hypothetical protein
MKLYSNIGRLVHRRLFGRHDRELFKWLLSLKPGDVIGACTGVNHIVKEIVPTRLPHRNGWFIYDIRVTDDQGQWHWAPGGGCVCRPYSRDEVLKFAAECAAWDVDTHGWTSPEGRAWWQAILDAEARGEPTIDARGVYTGPP